MATLNSSNITDGNTVEPNDLLQLYDAFTSGGGTTGAYSVSISGSLTGSASTATSASYALSASFSTSASFATSSSRAVSSSFAITASYALNGGSGGTSTAVTLQRPNFEALPAKPFAGSGSFENGIRVINMSTAFPDLSPSALGTDLFVTAMAASNTEYVGVSFTSPNLIFRSSTGAGSGIFYYQGWSK
jgi:hypothetical protein